MPQGAIEEELTPVSDVRATDFGSPIEVVEGVLGEPKVSEVFELIGISPYSFDYSREEIGDARDGLCLCIGHRGCSATTGEQPPRRRRIDIPRAE